MVSVTPTQAGPRPESADQGRRMMPVVSPVGPSIGAMLRDRREALGATLAEVEAATKIRQKYLAALEADEWQALPGEVVGRGFLRNYAGYLGLEPTEIIDRRRSIADPSLGGALSSTSAGSALPPPREVDYRPKDLDLHDEPDTLEERRPPRLGPLLAIVAVVAILIGLWWGLSRFGGNLLDSVAAVGSGLSDRVTGLFASGRATATPERDALAAGVDLPARAEAFSTSVFGDAPAAGSTLEPQAAAAGNADAGFNSAAGGTSAPAAVPVLESPTATPTAPPPTPTPPPPPTPTPAAQTVTVHTLANLRAAPSTDGALAGSAEVGVALTVVGQSADAQWYLLDNGSWIFAQLVNAPASPVVVVDLNALPPVTAAEAAAPAAEGSTGGFVLPTATPQPLVEPTPVPQPQVVAASCADPRSVITLPGQGQTVSGLVSIVGTATHDNFASYKLEAGPDASALAFIGSGNSPVQGGTLGTLDSLSFTNGPITVRLTVIDQTGNFPPPCEVVVSAAN